MVTRTSLRGGERRRESAAAVVDGQRRRPAGSAHASILDLDPELLKELHRESSHRRVLGHGEQQRHAFAGHERAHVGRAPGADGKQRP
jgi:hypothetical protein